VILHACSQRGEAARDALARDELRALEALSDITKRKLLENPGLDRLALTGRKVGKEPKDRRVSANQLLDALEIVIS